ncbi:MAG: cation:proton antiporter, partial [Gemmatimonadota bacterium]
GVALLLFTIGLELPWRRLRALGLSGALGGSLQILLTAAATVLCAAAIGMGLGEGTTLGMIVALSSTAVVFRILADRAQIDSVPGRVSVAILLVQDVAVIPLLLLLPVIAGAGVGPDAYRGLGGAVTRGILLIAVLFLLARTLLPLLFNAAATARNRELFVILALTFCLGATWAAHALGLSEVLGAFVAGVALADTKFASQMRAEIGSLRAGFLALFFVSIGMLANPAWVARHALLVVALVAAIVVGKTAIVALVVKLVGYSTRVALASGLALAHVGELSFVVAETGRSHQLLDPDVFRLVVSVSVLTLLLAPYLIASADRLVSLARRRPAPAREGEPTEEVEAARRSGHVIVVGCGPTGLRVV